MVVMDGVSKERGLSGLGWVVAASAVDLFCFGLFCLFRYLGYPLAPLLSLLPKSGIAS